MCHTNHKTNYETFHVKHILLTHFRNRARLNPTNKWRESQWNALGI